MFKKIADFLMNRKGLLILLVIYLTGLSLRLYGIENQVWSLPAYDDSRDFLVAEHILRYGEHVSRGPLVAGGFGWLLNSPAYYYLVVFLTLVGQNPVDTMIAWAVLTSLVIPAAYLASKKTLNHTFGLLAAFIFSVHPIFILHSQELFQPYLMPLLMLGVFTALVQAITRNTLKTVTLFVVALSLPIHFHYGILLLAPALLFWFTRLWYLRMSHSQSYRDIFIPLGTGIAGFLIWVQLTYHKYFLDQAYFFIFNFEDVLKKNTSFVKSFAITGREIVTFMIPYQVEWISGVIFLTLLVLAGLLIRSHYQSKTGPVTERLLALVTLAGSVILIPFSGSEYKFYYLAAILPFFFLVLCLGLYFAYTKSKASFVCLLVPLLVIWKGTIAYQYGLQPAVSFYDETRTISQQIALDLGDRPEHFALAQLESTNFHPYDYWATSPFWYHLEQIYHQPLVVIHNGGVNHTPIVGAPNTIYFICDHRIEVEKMQHWCQDRFEAYRNYLVIPPEILYQSERYTVFKYLVDSTQAPTYSINLVYYDEWKE